MRFQRPEFCHLEVVRLRSPRATSLWLSDLTRRAAREQEKEEGVDL